MLIMTQLTTLLGKIHIIWKALLHLWYQNLQKHVGKYKMLVPDEFVRSYFGSLGSHQSLIFKDYDENAFHFFTLSIRFPVKNSFFFLKKKKGRMTS